MLSNPQIQAVREALPHVERANRILAGAHLSARSTDAQTLTSALSVAIEILRTIARREQ
jgi:hypothetical protein